MSWHRGAWARLWHALMPLRSDNRVKSIMSLSGQWVARYTGANNGTIVIEIDEVGDHYEGAACVWDNDPNHPSSLVRFRTPSKDSSQTMRGLQVIPMDGRGTILSQEQLGKILP